MKRLLAWLAVLAGLVAVLVIAAALILPQFIDLKSYKPVIEQKVAQATGRTFSMGDDMDLSIFPWVGVKLTDIRLGNPEGFSNEQMVTVKNFEVRLKVMPLLSRKVEVATFVLDSPAIFLEKRKDGSASWLGIGPDKPADAEARQAPTDSGDGALPIESLKVDSFSILNATLVYLDKAAGTEKKVEGFNLTLADISLDKPVSIELEATVDNKPVSLSGSIGPIGKEPGKGTMTLNLLLKAMDTLETSLAGTISDPASDPRFDLTLSVSPFSPRKLFQLLSMELPVTPSDPAVLEKLALNLALKGSPSAIEVSDGTLVLDDSTLLFSAGARAFSKPDIRFDLSLDSIDLDRYLPEPPPAQDRAAEPETSAGPAGKKKTDYAPLRRLLLDGTIKAGKVKAHGAMVENVVVGIRAENGLITVDPCDLDLYQGKLDTALSLDVRTDTPKTGLTLAADGIQVGPLLKDAAQKEVLEGQLKADIRLAFAGDQPDQVKKSLNGKGGLLFNDGAIIGIDLAGMVRNVKAKFGGQQPGTEKPRTDFAELNIPFTARNGLVKTDGTRMLSPLIRVVAKGDIDLVKEMLDMRVDPKFVATLKGQGDTKARSGLMVPVLITGSFASPKIRPDLAGMIGGGVPALDPGALKDQVLGGGSKAPSKKELKGAAEDVKKQLKGLLPGLGN